MKNFNWKDLLGQHSLFQSLDSKEVERIIAHLLDDKVSKEREYSSGTIIVREGEPGGSVFLVGRGSVQVVLEGENGAGTPIATLRQGEFFGEMALLEKKPRAATVKAKESCILLEIKGQEFLKLLDEQKDVESKILLKLSERLRHANDQVLAVRVKAVDEKIDALKVKHEAELKAVDAQLKAALAIFDQTKLRTDEIISSAERSRAQRTWFFGIMATLVSVGAALGLKELIDLKSYTDQAGRAMQVINEITPQIEKIQPSARKLEYLASSFDRIVLSTEQPKFREALLNGTDKDIGDTYSTLKTIHANYRWYLNDIELAMKDRPRRNYTQILQAILEEVQNPEDYIRAHYLLLTTGILTDSVRDFEKQLQNLKNYVNARGPFDFKYDVSLLNSVFEKEPAAKQRRYKQVVQSIPTL
ncbi:MAG: Crp/Fnr family transcriptional regulator [Alphaproteobacteria bacterium]